MFTYSNHLAISYYISSPYIYIISKQNSVMDSIFKQLMNFLFIISDNSTLSLKRIHLQYFHRISKLKILWVHFITICLECTAEPLKVSEISQPKQLKTIISSKVPTNIIHCFLIFSWIRNIQIFMVQQFPQCWKQTLNYFKL